VRPRPAAPAPTNLPRAPIGLVGLAPEGAVPSTPLRGESILQFMFGHTEGDPGRFSLDVYQDGRIIWQKLGNVNDPISTGLVEQRLTTSGVEVIWAEVLSTGLFDRDVHLVGAYGLHFGEVVLRHGGRLVHVSWGDIDVQRRATATATPEQVTALKRLDARLEGLASWLPASAWSDATKKAFVPARYSLCFETERNVGLSRVLGSLPRSARDTIRELDLAYGEGGSSRPSFPWHTWCSAVTTEQARALAAQLKDAHIANNGGDEFGLVFDSKPRGRYALEVSISFAPLLPHLP
jgi:hypothetical protein